MSRSAPSNASPSASALARSHCPAPGKWTYVVGDLDIEANAGDIIEAALKFAATSDGLIPWRERPLSFRKGVISRVPPLPQSLEEV